MSRGASRGQEQGRPPSRVASTRQTDRPHIFVSLFSSVSFSFSRLRCQDFFIILFLTSRPHRSRVPRRKISSYKPAHARSSDSFCGSTRTPTSPHMTGNSPSSCKFITNGPGRVHGTDGHRFWVTTGGTDRGVSEGRRRTA